MEHKAFLFDFEKFSGELLPILEHAVATGDCEQLRDFILTNRVELSDPYEGEPLGDEWEAMIETRDPHQYGDFALTKYYSPTEDIGLGFTWREAQERLGGVLQQGESPILGIPLISDGNIFDPGKMGSYFQPADVVRRNLRILEALRRDIGEICDKPIQLLRLAADLGKGLYITF